MASQSDPKRNTEKPTLASNPYNPNSAAYLAYPVKHVVSSLYRRMTEPPDQPVSRLLDAPAVSKSNTSSGQATPRRSSPFQPPPLSPLTLKPNLSDRAAEGLLLTRSLAEEIRLLIPPRLQLLTSWSLAFSLDNHGSSLATLFDTCEKITGSLGSTQRGGFIIVIRDGSALADSGSVFGAYLTDAPKPSQGYYGTGECFLWRASILPSLRKLSAQLSSTGGRNNHPSEDLLELAGLPPPPSADTTYAQRVTTVRGERRRSSTSQRSKPTSPSYNGMSSSNGTSSNPFSPTLDPPRIPSPAPSGSSTPDRIRFKAFPYSGINDFMIYCQSSFLSVGGGDGHYGLWLDDQLDCGISETCPTFGNEPLSDENVGGHKGRFEVVGCEVWHVGAEGD